MIQTADSMPIGVTRPAAPRLGKGTTQPGGNSDHDAVGSPQGGNASGVESETVEVRGRENLLRCRLPP